MMDKTIKGQATNRSCCDVNKKLYRKSLEKGLAILTLAAGEVCGYSQGQVNLGDYCLNDFQITVWSPGDYQVEGNSPTNFGTGLLSTGPDIPTGVQTGYSGVPLGGSWTGEVSLEDYANGTLWSVQLYAAPGQDTPSDLLRPVIGAIGYMGPGADNKGLCVFNGTVPTIPGVPAGAVATLQLRAWYNGNGQIFAYEQAISEGYPAGQSTTGSERLGGGTIPPPDLPSPAGDEFGNTAWVSGGITSFNLCEIPLTPLSPPAEITSFTISQGAVQLRVQGGYEQDYFLQASADLLHWTNLADLALTTGNCIFSVPTMQNSPQFFRLFSVQ